MKTKTIITAVLLLFSLTSFAQTKEETISWLKEKLQANISPGGSSFKEITIQSVNECEIVIMHKLGEANWKYTLPTKIKNIIQPGFQYEDEVVLVTIDDKAPIKSKFCFLQLKEDEENLRAEVVKAMNHLSTFCKEKKF